MLGLSLVAFVQVGILFLAILEQKRGSVEGLICLVGAFLICLILTATQTIIDEIHKGRIQ